MERGTMSLQRSVTSTTASVRSLASSKRTIVSCLSHLSGNSRTWAFGCRNTHSVISSGRLQPCFAIASEKMATQTATTRSDEVRVRFAPSPTGNLHVGGARTALFNWLYARKMGGKFILRVEDTDASRSTRESEEAVLRDLKWLGLEWDEGPDCGGPHGPYRQSERKDIYMEYVNKLVAEGHAYPCFCTDEEIDAMKAEAEAKGLPPVYRGKWKTATQGEVDAELAKGKVPVYRFRVPENEEITIMDEVRGPVSWNTSTLGDFVIMRSNGLPVYNFCVTVDDALMKITHVLRAEEHLPNTLRQALIYRALGFPEPKFAHISIILAPDRSKLSKRHGATSVGQFAEMGYLPQAMINYLALLGWNDGTEQEFFTTPDLQDKFSIERVTKSAAVFDKEKLAWMNGQILRGLDDDQLADAVMARLTQEGLVGEAGAEWVRAFAVMSRKSLELLTDADKELLALVSYPLAETLETKAGKKVAEDDFASVVRAVLEAYESGELRASAESGALKKLFAAIGEAQGRSGKRLFMPLRVALTGTTAGPDVPEQMRLLVGTKGLLGGKAAEGLVDLDARMAQLKAWLESQ